MRIESYNPTDMTVVSASITGVDFGNAVKGQLAPNVVAIRAIPEGIEVLDAIGLFLEDNDGLGHTNFGKYKSNTATQGITPGSAYLSDFFVEVPGISDISQISEFSDQGLVLNASNPEYVWIDAEIGTSENSYGASSINLRFVFEFV